MDEQPPWRMDKRALVISDLDDDHDEQRYWWAQSPEDRLRALEYLRQVMYGYNPTTDRLQRVLAIVERPSG